MGIARGLAKLPGWADCLRRDLRGGVESRVMVQVEVTITKFTGAGSPTIVVGPPRIEPQGEPKPSLRLIHDSSS